MRNHPPSVRPGQKILALTVVVVATAASVPGLAWARRGATADQRAAIVRVVFGARFPVRCGVVYISTVNPAWASAQWVGEVEPIARIPHGCRALGSNGVSIVHLEKGRWRAVTAGSSFVCPLAGSRVYPGQPSVPNRVADDLVPHLGC